MALTIRQKQRILDLADGLEYGDVAGNRLCPFCDGGQTKERTFAVGASAFHMWYKCHRARCGAKGRFSRGPVFEEGKDPEDVVRKQAVDKECDRAAVMGEYYRQRNNTPDLVHHPLYGGDGSFIGYESRGNAPVFRRVKMVTGEEPRCFLHWTNRSVTVPRPLIVVEDWLSASAASKFSNAYALMGTNFTETKLDECKKIAGNGPIWLCLDKDASVKAAQYVIDYRFLAPNLKFMPITKDLKHWALEDLEEFICG